MKENEVYSIRSKSSSEPHKVAPSKPGSKSQSVQPTIPEPSLPPIPATPAVTQPVQPQNPPIAILDTPTTPPLSTPMPMDTQPQVEQSQLDQAQAIALARSKIEAIYGGQAMDTKPSQTPQIAEGYAKEQIIQATIDPNNIPAQPDHQLPAAGSAQQYGEYALPGAAGAQAQVNTPQSVAAPATVAAKKPLKSVKDKISKVNTSKVKQKAKSHLSKAKKLSSKIQKTHKEIKTADQKSKPLWKRLTPAVSLVLIVTLILNNQLVYGQISYYVTPGNRIETPTIVETEAGNQAPAGDRIIIPKINVDVPVNYKVKTYDEEAIQQGLEDGVVHYANTGMPGEVGNNVLLGHNTNNFWNSGKYKTAFVLLDRLKEGDTFEVHHKKTRYVYEIYQKKVIEPDDFSVVTQKVTEPVITLITCHPPGTSWQRLIIQARQISPEPAKSATTKGNDLPETVEGNVPGAAPGPLEDIFSWLFN